MNMSRLGILLCLYWFLGWTCHYLYSFFTLKLLSNKFHFLFLFMSNSSNAYLFTIPANYMFIWHILCICLTWHDIGHLNLGDWFYQARWVFNPFPSCKLASELRSRVLDYALVHVICKNCKQICVRGIWHKEKQKMKLVR